MFTDGGATDEGEMREGERRWLLDQTCHYCRTRISIRVIRVHPWPLLATDFFRHGWTRMFTDEGKKRGGKRQWLRDHKCHCFGTRFSIRVIRVHPWPLLATDLFRHGWTRMFTDEGEIREGERQWLRDHTCHCFGTRVAIRGDLSWSSLSVLGLTRNAHETHRRQMRYT